MRKDNKMPTRQQRDIIGQKESEISRFDHGHEPNIDELMADESIQKVMACDGVKQEHLQSLMSQVRLRLQAV